MLIYLTFILLVSIEFVNWNDKENKYDKNDKYLEIFPIYRFLQLYRTLTSWLIRMPLRRVFRINKFSIFDEITKGILSDGCSKRY